MAALRYYQQDAHDAAMGWVRQSLDPCLVEAATGAGKSHIISALANTLHGMSKGKHILCLAPSAELVTQNREKYLATGNPASIFSASAGGACLRHPVVFGTPGTVKNKVSRFGEEFCAVIIDEAHRLTPTIKLIIDKMRERNARLRVVGLSATPYRLGSGYIYAMDENSNPMGDTACRDPYFTAKVFTVGAHELIDQGYLTRPMIGAINTDGYETLSMQVNSRGQFDAAEVDRAFHGHGRKTSAIVADVVRQSRGRNGVMLFAATVQHAQEIMASLPPGLSALITGKTGKDERRRTIERFKAREIKYLVNVSVLTTGFDASHVDVIAILRATESVSLLQQIIGRGLRIDDDKADCLVLDYAENIDRHCPDGDLFSPDIKAAFRGEGNGTITAECELCGTENLFSARMNQDALEHDKNGYFLDLTGRRVETDHGPMPAHYGRRCQGLHKCGPSYAQCNHRWTLKTCPQCDAENDIAARYCSDCKGELIDPSEKLRIEFKALKRDATRVQTDKVVEWIVRPTTSQRGNECLRVDYVTEYRSFSIWYQPEATRGRQLADYHQFCEATEGGIEMPETITYKKDADTRFYRIYGYNRPADEAGA